MKEWSFDALDDDTAKNTVILPNFPKLSKSFSRNWQITRNYAETMPFRKISKPVNLVKLRYFPQCEFRKTSRARYWKRCLNAELFNWKIWKSEKRHLSYELNLYLGCLMALLLVPSLLIFVWMTCFSCHSSHIHLISECEVPAGNELKFGEYVRTLCLKS